MALVKCKECGKEVSSAAKACPGCGAKPAKSIGLLGGLSLLFVAFVVYKCTSYQVAQDPVPKISPAAAALADYTDAAPGIKATAKTKWTYRNGEDKMSGRATRFASIDSEELITLEFPYQGHNQPHLTLRKNGKGTDVLFTVTKGQIVCGVSECPIKVKFDGQAASTYSGVGSSDHDSTVLFLEPAGKLISQIKKSKRMLVEITMYQAGTKVITFDVAGLDWPK